MILSERSFKILVAFALLLLATAPAGAQTPVAATGAPSIAPSIEAEGSLERLLAERPLVNRALTVEESVALALRESPVLRGAAEEVEAALGQLNAARAEKRPMLSANTFLSGGSIANIVESPPLPVARMIMNLPRGGYFDQNLMLMAPLYTGGRLKTLVRQATALRDASQAELEGQRQEVALLTRTAYHEAQARRALVDVQQARLRENQEQLRLDRIRAEEGKIPPFFVQRAEAEVAATQQELTNAQRDVELALLQLKTVMGVHPASEIGITGVLEYQPSALLFARLSGTTPTGATSLPASSTAPGTARPDITSPDTTTPQVPAPSTGSTAPGVAVPGSEVPGVESPTASGAAILVPSASAGTFAAALTADLSSLLRVAERGRPELRAAGLRITSAEAEAAAIGQSYRPQVNAFIMGDIAKSQGQRTSAGTTFGIAASIPIFTGGRRRAAMQTAQAQSRRQQRERERVLLEVAQSVNSAYVNLRAAEQNIGTAQAALRSAQEDYRVMLIRYQAGKSILVELLDALATRVRAESNVVQALFGYNVARDQLLRAVGALDFSDSTTGITPSLSLSNNATPGTVSSP